MHLAHIGHPLVGDPAYLRRIPGVAKGLKPHVKDVMLDFPRQALHAARLGFTHPRTREPMLFETPLPADMLRLLSTLDGMQP